MHAYVFQAIQSPIVSENPWKLAEEADKVGGPWMPVSSPLSGAWQEPLQKGPRKLRRPCFLIGHCLSSGSCDNSHPSHIPLNGWGCRVVESHPTCAWLALPS